MYSLLNLSQRAVHLFSTVKQRQVRVCILMICALRQETIKTEHLHLLFQCLNWHFITYSNALLR